MNILESVISNGGILESNVVVTPVLESEVVYAIGRQGPQGPAGPAGGSIQTYPAGQTLSTGRVVIIEDGSAYYFQHTDPTHHGRAYGLTVTSASAIGADVDVQLSGYRADASFGFTANKVLFVGANGQIFDTLPIGGVIIQKAGIAGEDKKMIIDFSVSLKINT